MSIRIQYDVFVDWEQKGFWTEDDNIVEHVQQIDLSYGRDNPDSITGRIRGGSCDIRLRNDSGDYTPFNRRSPYFNQIIPGRRIQVRARAAGDTYVLWTGFLKEIKPYDVIDNVPYSELTAVGPWTWLDQARYENILTLEQFNQSVPGNERIEFLYSGQVLSELLDEVEWKGYGKPEGRYTLQEPGPYGRRLSPGQALIDLNALIQYDKNAGPITETIRTIKSMRTIELAEPGFIWEDPEANIVFEDRFSRIRIEPGTLFSDHPDAAFTYAELDLGSYLDNLFNVFFSGEQKYIWANLEQIIDVVPNLYSTIEIDPGNVFEETFVIELENTNREGYAFVDPWRTPVPGPVGLPITDPGYSHDPDVVGSLVYDVAADFSANPAVKQGAANGSLQVRVRKGMHSITIQLENTHPSRNIFVNKLRARGYPANSQQTRRFYKTDDVSVGLYGPREYPIPTNILKHRGSLHPVSQDYRNWASQLAAIYSYPRPQATMTMYPRLSAAMAAMCLGSTISKRLTVRSVDHGLYDPDRPFDGHDFFIEKVRHFIKPGTVHKVEWGMSSSEHVEPIWRLGRGRLGTTTMLTY